MWMMNDALDPARGRTVRGRAALYRFSAVLRFLRCRLGGRRAPRRLLELDDYLLEDMGLARDWFIAERRRLGILPGFRDMSGRHLVRSGIRHARGMRDGFW